MIDGTGLVLVLTFLGVAFVRALRSRYREGWHEDRADLLREQAGARRLGVQVRYDATTRPHVVSFFDQEADA